MKKAFACIAVLGALVMPTAALAVDWLPIVQCGRSDQVPEVPCTPCFMFKTVENVSDLIFKGITGPLAAFMFVVAGGMFLIGAGNVKLQQQARTLFTNTVIGIVVIFVAWIGTNFLIKNIAPNSVAAGGWSHFACPKFLADITLTSGQAPAIVASRVISSDKKPSDYTAADLTVAVKQQLALANNEPLSRKNSGALIALIACIYQDPIIQAIAYPMPNLGGSANQANITTYDNTNDVCNYTRGVPYGQGACSHSRNSCHYGGNTGNQGAEAVDMNARKVWVTVPGTNERIFASEDRLFCELATLYEKCKFGFLNWEGEHTHISTSTCDADGSGTSAKKGFVKPSCPDSARAPAAVIPVP
jgi:hypothetical protein